MKIIFLAFFSWLCIASVASAQPDIPNGGFEEFDKHLPTQTAGWEKEGSPVFCGVDSVSPLEGRYSFKLAGDSATALNFFRREFPFSQERPVKYYLVFSLRTHNLAGSAGMGVRVLDASGQTISFSYEATTTSKNQKWKEYEIPFYSDETAATIRVFGRLQGTGEVWFDKLSMYPTDGEPAHDDAEKYIEEYFAIVSENSIERDPEFLNHLKSVTKEFLCHPCYKASDAHAVLKKYTTLKLGDGHSFFSTPADWKEMNDAGKMSTQGLVSLPSGRMTENGVAYLNVPTFVSMDEKVMTQYADTMQAIMSRLEKRRPRGWIIDLSENQGGNCFPMLAGLGAFIGDGVVGCSISGNGKKKVLIQKNGWAGWDSTMVFQDKTPFHFQHPGYPVAILYGNHTGSSGEVTAISFIGTPGVRTFGQKTSGATTRIDNFKLSDGAYLNLACGYDADRFGNIYKSSLVPDVETDTWEKAMEEAERWILGRESGE